MMTQPTLHSLTVLKLQPPFNTSVTIFDVPQATAQFQFFDFNTVPTILAINQTASTVFQVSAPPTTTLWFSLQDKGVLNLQYATTPLTGSELSGSSVTIPPFSTSAPSSNPTTASRGPDISPVSSTTTSQSNGLPTEPTSGSSPWATSATGPTQQPNPNSNNGLPSGAVAGVAIGCLLAGALIAGLAAFFFFRRKRRSGLRGSEASSMALIHREKGPAVNAMSLESGGPLAAGLGNGLPLPLEDNAISGEISKISNLIKNHVQSFYITTRTSPVLIDFDDLQALGSDMPISTGALSTLLGNPATREIALRFCIAWIVVSRMQLDSPPHTTFLPQEVAMCLQAMAQVDRGSRVNAAYFAKWRAITAELMQSIYVRNPFSATDGRLHNLQFAADQLNVVLRPYSDSRIDDKQRTQNLEEILKRSASFAFTLFSQPSMWDFDWQDAQDVKSGSLCVFPTLLQMTDENGEPIKPAKPFNEAVVRRLDE